MIQKKQDGPGRPAIDNLPHFLTKMSSLMIDDVSVDQDLLGDEVARIMNELMLSSQELAEECAQHPSLRARGHDELNDYEHARCIVEHNRS